MTTTTKYLRAQRAAKKHWEMRRNAKSRGDAQREVNAILNGWSDVAPSVKEKAEFRDSWEWTKLRMETLKRYGAVCMCCGATKGNGVSIQVDHIRPLARFWGLRMDPDNLQVLCNECNKGKAAWDDTDWRPKP